VIIILKAICGKVKIDLFMRRT